MMKFVQAALLSCVLLTGACTPVPEVRHDQQTIDNGDPKDHFHVHQAGRDDACPNLRTQGHC